MLKRLWNWLLGKTTIDEKIEEKVDNAKRTITAVKAKGKKVIEEVKDVVDAINAPIFEGKVTKSKLRELKKSELQSHAKVEFNEDFDDSVTKSNLINKIYELHKEAK